MKLEMDGSYGQGYKSASQRARRVTERWVGDNLYCVACTSPRIVEESTNSEAVDFTCGQCSATYQLKASKSWSEHRIPDAGYEAMMRALRSDSVPNLLLMQYDPQWIVQNLLVIPSFFFTVAAVEKRRPLSPTARRAGWVGCNILLSQIAQDGKIRIVTQGICRPKSVVRSTYEQLRPFSNVEVKLRGWTLDVLRIIRKIGRSRFSLEEVYDYKADLARIYPKNMNVNAKIRQQLQVLRDLGYLKFEGDSQYQILR